MKTEALSGTSHHMLRTRSASWLLVCALSIAISGAACGNGTPAPDTIASKPRLVLAGELTVTSQSVSLGLLEVYIDEKLLGSRGGADPFGSASLTVPLGVSLSTSAATALQAGVHQLVVLIQQNQFGPDPPPSSSYSIESSSHVDVLDSDTRQLLGTRILGPRQVIVNGRMEVSWTITVDPSGKIR